MNPANISRVKRVMRKINHSDVKQILDRLMSLATAEEVAEALGKEMHQLYPQLFAESSI
jgi:phosphoenolpyruvate-protein kinase (PTS system EI component)